MGIVELAFLTFLATRPTRSEGARVAAGLVLLYAVAFALVVPLAFASDWSQWSPYSPVVVSRFQPWMFGALGLHSAACATLWRSTGLGASAAARGAQVVGIAAALLTLSSVVFPELVAGAAEAWRWLAKEEVFQELVRESKPLFYDAAEFDAGNAVRRLSRFLWVFPFAVVALAWRAWESRQRPALLLLLL